MAFMRGIVLHAKTLRKGNTRSPESGGREASLRVFLQPAKFGGQAALLQNVTVSAVYDSL